jgi:hypothetical protein
MVENSYFNTAETRKEVKYPAQVGEFNLFNSEMMYVLLSSGKTRVQYKKDFIFATEEEIKNEITRKKLKSVFIK